MVSTAIVICFKSLTMLRQVMEWFESNECTGQDLDGNDRGLLNIIPGIWI
jgi:hypothetical protein